MDNQVIIDLSGIINKDQLLKKLGEVFEFGGPGGNIPVSSLNAGKGWGLNWDALNDSLMYLSIGGIWGTSRKFMFPLIVVFKNSHELQKNEKESFEILREILKDSVSKYKSKNIEFILEFI
jgi:hypothetical protein